MAGATVGGTPWNASATRLAGSNRLGQVCPNACTKALAASRPSRTSTPRNTFIRRARTLGLSLEDIAAVLTIHRDGAPPCGTVREPLDAHIIDIDRTIADLQALRATLTQTRHAADRTAAAVCPIIDLAH
ncbi:hypothetical protein E1258_23510 [Micromonospora sp. KC207]|nr:hypothetical protein E1258_23510 [Micromonospora sp. KC207]